MPPLSRSFSVRVLQRGLALVLLLAAATGPATAASSTPPAPRLKVIGYVMDGPQLPAISARKLDAINFAFALVDPHGVVYLPGDTAPGALAGLVELRQRNPDLKVLLAIGGWGAGNFSEAALTAQARARFAESAALLAREHQLDGIDIDWEYPTLPGPGISHRPEDRANFVLLLQAVRARLDALDRQRGGHTLLTIAAADGEAARGLDLVAITPLLDWINLMTYDFHASFGAVTGHHAGLDRSASAPEGSRNAVQAVDEFLAAGVPAAKINLGVAFYSRAFEGVAAIGHGLNQAYAEQGEAMAWRELRDLPGRDGWERHWDARAQAPWLWNPRYQRFIGYDDPQSLAAKAAFVRARGLGGMMYWEHRHDRDDELLDAMRGALDAPDPVETPAP